MNITFVFILLAWTCGTASAVPGISNFDSTASIQGNSEKILLEKRSHQRIKKIVWGTQNQPANIPNTAGNGGIIYNNPDNMPVFNPPWGNNQQPTTPTGNTPVVAKPPG